MVVMLPGVPAIARASGIVDTVGRDEGPVQQEVLVSSLQRSGDDITQGWCLDRRDDVAQGMVPGLLGL